MFQIAAFDLDGTIADTIPICIEAFQRGAAPYACCELGRKEIMQTFGLNETGMVRTVVKENYESALSDFYIQYERLHEKVTEPFCGILSLFAFLKENGVILALVTGKGEKSCAISLKKLGLSEVFDEVLYGSELYPNKKENMEYLMKRYSVSNSNFCYTGDTVQDVKACRDAGVACFSAAWQKSCDVSGLERENPGHVFYTVNALHEYFKQALTRV